MIALRIVVLGVILRDVYSGFCTVPYTCYATCSQRQAYYLTCGGWWWGSSTCLYYRTVYKQCPSTCYRQQCCSGYTGNTCDTPLCGGMTTCPNGGTCVSPDTCECPPGYGEPFCADILNPCSAETHDCEHSCISIFGSYVCQCRARYEMNSDGKTCTEDCWHPGNITDGTVSVTSTLRDGTATYTCNAGYTVSSGDQVRTCRSDFTWSGQEPTCLFSNYCESSPCRNGGTCVDFIGSKRCDCTEGWDGEFCDNDQSPPMMFGCSNDTHVNATEKTISYTWSEPSFNDSRGSEIEVVSNYETPEFTFPWGDFTVQYVATKTSNGLQTECAFDIKVRPTPCEPLNVPVDGALLCNGWQTDYGQFCMVMCRQNFTLGPSYSFLTWYICGASGNWAPAGPVPDCEVPVESEIDGVYYNQEYASHVYTTPACENEETKSEMQNLYIESLNGTKGLSSFCSSYGNECVKENVDVKC